MECITSWRKVLQLIINVCKHIHTILLVKCLALWGEREQNGRHYSRPADCTALGTAVMSQSAFEQSNADRNRLDRECCHNHLVASLGESWDRDPGALCWRLRSPRIPIFGLLFMSIT